MALERRSILVHFDANRFISLAGWFILFTFARVRTGNSWREALIRQNHTMQQSANTQSKGERTIGEEHHWYVLLVAYRTELKIKDLLRELGQIEAFVPMRRIRKRDKQGRFCYEEKVALNNYVFVHTSYKRLLQLKAEHPFKLDFNFMLRDVYEGMKKVGRTPVIVPRQQMLNFIAIAGNQKERVQFLDAEKIDWNVGQRVRVVAGPFAGVEGIYLSTTRKHERRVVVQLEGIAAVATTALPAVLVEKIDDEKGAE